MLKPEEMLKHSQNRLRKLAEMRAKAVKVGLFGDRKYDNGDTVASVGAQHEYGTRYVPQRSFLRVPFAMNQDRLDRVISGLLKKVVETDMSVERGLGLIGTEAKNISKAAFRNNGYGTWEALSEARYNEKAKRKRTLTLVDTTLLRESIAWEIVK